MPSAKLSGDARLEIETTLRHTRDETEQIIAPYRLILFSFGTLITSAMHLFREEPWTPVLTMAVSAAYAGVAWLVVRRLGAPKRVVYTLAALDTLFASSSFVTTHFAVGHRADAGDAQFPMLVLPAILFAAIMINSLRFSRATAAIVGVLAVALFAFIEPWEIGFQAAEIPTAVILAFAGAIAYAGASRTRRNLDHFARLQLLRRYLSPAAVERVLRDNPDGALALGGELRTVTLLAADLRAFTAMSEKLSAQEVIEQLNEYHGSMLEVIDRHGGLLDKFIGDGTLAVFGLEPRTSLTPDAGATAGVACAREMGVALTALNARRATRDLPPLRMGVGVHTGEVIAGNIGAPGRRLEFTVIGDSVNVVARLEGLTKEAGVPVLVSEATAQRLANRDGLTAMPSMRAKGKQQLLEVLAVA